jgi:hypothetical protein
MCKDRRAARPTPSAASHNTPHALDPDLQFPEAVHITNTVLSPEVHHILTVERGWTAGQYERWLVRSLGTLLRREPGASSSTEE